MTLDPGEEHVVIVKLDTESFDLSRVGRHEITLDFSLKAPPDAIPAHAPCRIVAEELIVRASGRLVLD